MGFIVNMYKKEFLKRYDKEEAVPYYSADDFKGLVCDEGSFINSVNVNISFFSYRYEEYDGGKLILFCPGMGPGHTAYLAEIETICRAGYRVLTLDYTGCGASGGDRMTSVNAPVRDAVELLGLLEPEEEIIPVGHSLGGYTALSVANLLQSVKKAVVISGFIGISDEMMGLVKFRFLADRVKKYEKKLDPVYGNTDNMSYLKTTGDRILWIHSTDDPMVNYRYNAGQLLKINNPNVHLITVEGKKHNPQYSASALETMNEWMGGYYRLIREGKLVTPEEKTEYFTDKPVGRMTEQDPEIFDSILGFIKDIS